MIPYAQSVINGVLARVNQFRYPQGRIIDHGGDVAGVNAGPGVLPDHLVNYGQLSEGVSAAISTSRNYTDEKVQQFSPASAITAHEAKADPHPQYIKTTNPLTLKSADGVVHSQLSEPNGTSSVLQLDGFAPNNTTQVARFTLWRNSTASDGQFAIHNPGTTTLNHLLATSSDSYLGISGKVGIGINSPTAKLDVAGDCRFGNGTFAQAVKMGNIRIWTGNAAPTSGTYQVGDRVLNSSPTAGSYCGWICTAAGTPGIWKGFGMISL